MPSWPGPQPLPRNGYKLTLARNLIVATLEELSQELLP